MGLFDRIEEFVDEQLAKVLAEKPKKTSLEETPQSSGNSVQKTYQGDSSAIKQSWYEAKKIVPRVAKRAAIGAVVAPIALTMWGQLLGGVNTDSLPDVKLPKNVSYVSDSMERLMDRELKTYGWTSNAIVNPYSFRIDTSPHQKGIANGVNLMMRYFYDTMSHSGGEAHTTRDLNEAHRAFTSTPEQWQWSPPFVTNRAQADTATVFTNGVDYLHKYNAEMAKGSIDPIDRRIETAVAFVDRLDLILSQTQELLEKNAVQSAKIDNIGGRFVQGMQVAAQAVTGRAAFYEGLGNLNAVAEFAKAGKKDFADVIHLQSADGQYAKMEKRIQATTEWAAEVFLVLNRPQSSEFNNHLTQLAGDIGRIRMSAHALQHSLSPK